MAVHYSTASIVARIRTELDDLIEPYLVSDTSILEALDEIQHEFAEETLCFKDSRTFSYAVTASDPWIELDTRIIKLRNGYLTTKQAYLAPLTEKELELRVPNWRSSSGTPSYMVTDLDQGHIRLVPTPSTDDTLQLNVYRYPQILESVNDDLEVPDRWLPVLVSGVMSLIYDNQDLDMFDPKVAERWRADYAGRLMDAVAKIERHDRGPGTTTFNPNGVW